jgi:hypothetical protein
MHTFTFICLTVFAYFGHHFSVMLRGFRFVPVLTPGNGGEGARPWVSSPSGGCQFSSKNSAGYGSIDGVDATGSVYGPGGAALNSVCALLLFVLRRSEITT